MDMVKIVIGIGIAVVVAGLVYGFVVLPWQLRRGATKIQRSLPGDDLVLSPKTGYTQAITIRAPKSEVWR